MAVTTYSALFNSNPFFKAPDLIILDDAHAAENYVAKMWMLQVERASKSIQGLLQRLPLRLSQQWILTFTRLLTGARAGSDFGWVDKLPTAALAKVADEVRAILDEHDADPEVVFAWKQLADNLLACHMYVSVNQILIRPSSLLRGTMGRFISAKQHISCPRLWAWAGTLSA